MATFTRPPKIYLAYALSWEPSSFVVFFSVGDDYIWVKYLMYVCLRRTRQERAIRFQQEKTDREEAQVKAKTMKETMQAEAEAKRAATLRFVLVALVVKVKVKVLYSC